MSRNPAGLIVAMVDHGVVQVIPVSRSESIALFTGLEPGQFRKPMRIVATRDGDDIADSPPWAAVVP
jgi:hypothetical protein